MPRPSRSLILRYGSAVISIVLATVARWWIDPSLGDHLPFVTYFVAVLFTAWYGGLGPSLLAILLGACAAGYFFVPPRQSLRIDDLQHRVGLSLYFFVGLTGALFSEALQAARRRAEESALETARGREWLRVMLSSIGDAVIATDIQGRVTFLNGVAQELTGWPQEEAEGQPLEVVFRIVNERSRQTVENPVAKVLREGTIVGLANHTVLLAKNGAETPIDDSAAPIRDEQGRTAGVVLIFRDVTERSRADEIQRRLAAIVESSDDAIVGKALDGTITSWNAGAERLYGYTAAEILGKPFSLLVPSDRSEEVQASARRLAQGERLEHFETVRRRKDGSLVDVSVSYSPIKDSDGRLIGNAVITRDVTAQNRAEQELRDARARLEAALEAGAIFTWTWDIPNNRLYGDESLARLFNVHPSDAAGGLLDKFVKAIHPDDWPRVSAALNQSVEQGTDYEADYRVVQPDGSVRWVVARGRVERDDRERPVRMPGVLVDITERKAADEQLRHNERVSTFLADATTSLAALTDVESVLRRVAELAVPFFADWCAVDVVETGDVLRRLAIIHTDPEKQKLAEELRRRYPPRPTDPHGPQHVLRTGQAEMASEITDVMLTEAAHDDDYLSILRGLGLRSYICIPLIARGRTLGVLTFIAAESGRIYRTGDLRLAKDLAHRAALAVDNARLYSEVRDTLREKEESLALLDTLQYNAPLGFAFVDRQFRYIRINEALAEIDGSTPEYHLGRTVQETVPELWPELEPLYRRALEGGEPVTSHEVAGATPAAPGRPRHWLVNYYPVRVADEVVGVGIVVADITERKRLEQELRLRLEQLADADRRKDEFLATLAHELRNPLAPIRSGLEVLRMTKDDPQAMDEVQEMMERQIEQLITLVDDLLDVSRITRGKFQLRRSRVALAEVVRSAVEAARPFIDQARHELTVRLPEQPICLDADPHRLAQVISNLLNNAAKYTPEGGRIELTAERQGSDIAVTVKDTGMGIPAEKLESVFEMFTQIDRSMEQGNTGLGIGLTLVKSLVEMHGGRIEVRSDGPDQGSEFCVRLPILMEPPAAAAEPAAGQEPAATEATEASKQRVLIVDDNKAAADMLGIVVQKLGHETRTAGDGQEAIEIAAEFLPDVVLMDLGMPKVNGYDAARRIREQPWGEQMVLVALTGWGQEEDKRRTKEAGFDYHLVKPAEPAALKKLLADAQRTSAAREDGA